MMSQTAYMILTVITVILLVFGCVFNDKLVEFEDKVLSGARAAFINLKNKLAHSAERS